LSGEKAQKIGFLYVAPLTPELDDGDGATDGFVSPCATLDLAAVNADAECLSTQILEKTKKMIELVVRPLTDMGFRRIAQAGAHILHINIHGSHKSFAAEDGCGGLVPLNVQSFRSLITSGGFVNIELLVLCSPNQPASNIGQEFQELGIQPGAGVGGDGSSSGRAAFHILCIETEKLSSDPGAQTFLFAFYQTLMKGQPVQHSVDAGKQTVMGSMQARSESPCITSRRWGTSL